MEVAINHGRLFSEVGKTDVLKFSQAEYDFLRRYDPFLFNRPDEFSYDQLVGYQSLNLALRSKVFYSMVTMDAAVQRGNNLSGYVNEKKKRLNPYLGAVSDYFNTTEEDPLRAAFDLKMNSLAVLDLLRGAAGTKELENDSWIINRVNSLQDIYRQIALLVGEEIPVIVYGSYVRNLRQAGTASPHDVDLLVLPETLDFSLYIKLMDFAQKYNYNPQVQILVVPRNKIAGLMTANPLELFDPANSALIGPNRSITVPKITEEHRKNLAKYNLASILELLRYALTEQGINEVCQHVVKLNHRLKQPQYFKRDVVQAFGVELGELPEPERFSEIPADKDIVIAALTRANQQVNQMLEKLLVTVSPR